MGTFYFLIFYLLLFILRFAAIIDVFLLEIS